MSEDTADTPEDEGERSARDRLGESADRARSGFDDRVVDILSWMLDTETRARIYVYLRQHPWSTSEEVAEGTGLYPSTVREALAELADEDTVERRKRESEGAGNNPYEYTAIAPSDLVGGVVGGVQDELNTIFTLGREDDDQPVRIEVDGDDDDAEAAGEGSDADGEADASDASDASDAAAGEADSDDRNA
ncbi:putative transcriptional regulator [Halarchaeum rubridurum]|uniref:Transcriptional regulator n=1 Tax=Halarchaeum rubridurum TaxID=489911 RepID=A0A830FV31_9EURY|nr:winged helix-turn-helix domain-containing protein [Halarchaeum rubridurum]MBP1953635.1 putative transcriptional regulator [Halarchaeum rubridurum]GGM63793.1 transcriptional regulator [Halarchaeum rubridurum]